MLDRNAGGGAGSQLPQAVGLRVQEQSSGIGVVQADLERIAVPGVSECLDSEDAGVGERPTHHRQIPAGRGYAASGQVYDFTTTVFGLHFPDGPQHLGQVDATVYVGVKQEPGHGRHRLRSRVGQEARSGSGGEVAPIDLHVLSQIGGHREFVENGRHRTD